MSTVPAVMDPAVGPARGNAAWRMHLLAFSTLFCLFMAPAPSAFGMPLVWLVSLGLAVQLGAWRQFYAGYRGAVWGLAALIIVNALAAVVPGRALSGGYDLLRSVSLMLPALLLVERGEQKLVLTWLKVFVVLLSLAFGALYGLHAGKTDLTWHLYAWAELHFGNVHNLINVAALVLLSLVVIVAVERCAWQRTAFVGLLLFGLWYQWVLKSEGTWLALLLAAFAWAALRFAGAPRLLALLGLLGGVLGYAALMAWPDLAKAAAGISLGGFEIRAEINARVLELLAERPWLGYGMNNFKDLPEAAVGGISFFYPHQIYLEALFSLGVAGAAAFAAVLWAFFRFCSRATILAEPLGMLGFLVAVYLAGKGLTDMKLVAIQPLGIILMCAAFMSRGVAGGPPAAAGDPSVAR